MTEFLHDPGAAPSPLDMSDEFVAFNRTLRNDFYLSFKVSQGSQDLQRDTIFPLLGAQYRDTWSGTALQRLPEAIMAGTVAVAEWNMPSGHRRAFQGVEDMTINEGVTFVMMWQRLGAELKRGNPRVEVGNFMFDRLIGRLIHGMITRDNFYMGKLAGRHTRTASHADAFHSQYREYVLQDASTRSPTFDMLFAYAQERRTPVRALWGRMMLKRRWEKQHPGQQFVPHS